MAELRYNPLLDSWVMVSARRQFRPYLPKDHCPFCPGSGKVPDDYDVHVFQNDFPVLSAEPPEPEGVGGSLYRTREAAGRCEVVLYSSDHHATIPNLPKSHMKKVIDLWAETFDKLDKNEKHQYVMIFENRGEEVGVTITHPHGQVYAYPFIPQKVKIELENCKKYFQKTGRNMFDDIIKEEKQFNERIVLENDYFLAFIPFFTDTPFGLFIVSKENKTALTDFTEEEKSALGDILQDVIGGMDHLFDCTFPFMMGIHGRPSNSENVESYYRFHIEFYSPKQTKEKLKLNAASETAGWAVAIPTRAEDNAVLLRKAIQVFWENVSLTNT
ncbi:galactose-1-phosphate uridylyltransferase [Fictibacillus phosphorivorans]|uniref:galactose-1-phosphate uridylyltransferase n=1 Tax=Fictibacillus phosphorivorans TaxID=1221500 RepID=UPI00203C50A5|nr:galactose-1-phosphate uridylyltransferase [Fictibacillus phosphorivorans]MCM3719353.1 galactose-1-phosphate uridylyltransferase [Fictibacillus phosphorivorans]MCM3776974.1 galactose-1-phosphate uridylyltransferase [Fictibacillus phosphorivorans]